MTKKRWQALLTIPMVFAVGVFVGMSIVSTDTAFAQSGERVFELRTYTTLPGRLDALHARFRDHTMRIFEKHNMGNVAYFSPQDEPMSENTLIYIIAHDSRETAKANWQSFIADPEWTKVAEESQRDGRIIEKIDSVFMDATDYSPMK